MSAQDVSVPLKDSSDEQLLAELMYRTTAEEQKFGGAKSNGMPFAVWQNGNQAPSLPTTPPRANSVALATSQSATGMLVEYQPIRAWVDGKEDDKALLQNAEQVFVLNPTGNKVESLRSEIMRLRGKNEELGMRIQYETQRGHIGLLRHKLAAATKEQADAAAAAQRIKQLEAELMASRADRAKLAAMNQKLEAALAALRATLEQRNNSARSEAALLAEMRQREQQLTLTLRTYQEQAVVSSATLQEANSLRAELERFKGIAQQATSTLSRQVTENERLAGLLADVPEHAAIPLLHLLEHLVWLREQ